MVPPKILLFLIPVFALGLLFGLYLSPKGFAGEPVAINDQDYYSHVEPALSGAGTSIHMVMFEIKYYDNYPDSLENQLVRELIKKSREGVDVKVITDQYLTSNGTVEMLRAAGVQIKFDEEGRTTHSKLIIIDGEIVIIGSTNWSYYSIEKNRESNVMITSGATAGDFEGYFGEMWGSL